MISRRTILRGLGASVALPMLEAMVPRAAFAQQVATPPVRMAFLFVPNGISMEHWTPIADGAGFQLKNVLEPLAAYREDFSILTGLAQMNAFAHGDGPGDHARSSATWLTGVHPRKTSGSDIRAAVSADQIAAQRTKGQTKFASLELGCERGGLAGDCDSGYSCAYSNTISWQDHDSPLAKETSPRQVFERLFGSTELSADDEARARRSRDNLSVLDFVLDEAKRLDSRLGNRDRQKLEEYLNSVREIEQRILKFDGGGKAGNVGAVKPGAAPRDFGEHIRLMGDMMVLAFQADLTRICTFMFANEGSNRSYRDIGIADGHHDVSHHGKDDHKLEAKRKIDRYHVEQLAYVIGRMKQIKEGGSTLLDNTMLVYGGGISDGDRHNHDDLPILFAGRAGGSFKQGQHRRYSAHTPMNNLLVSMLDRFGVPGETLGDATGKLQPLW